MWAYMSFLFRLQCSNYASGAYLLALSVWSTDQSLCYGPTRAKISGNALAMVAMGADVESVVPRENSQAMY